MYSVGGFFHSRLYSPARLSILLCTLVQAKCLGGIHLFCDCLHMRSLPLMLLISSSLLPSFSSSWGPTNMWLHFTKGWFCHLRAVISSIRKMLAR
jgi:hypothetical protein